MDHELQMVHFVLTCLIVLRFTALSIVEAELRADASRVAAEGTVVKLLGFIIGLVDYFRAWLRNVAIFVNTQLVTASVKGETSTTDLAWFGRYDARKSVKRQWVSQLDRVLLR